MVTNLAPIFQLPGIKIKTVLGTKTKITREKGRRMIKSRTVTSTEITLKAHTVPWKQKSMWRVSLDT